MHAPNPLTAAADADKRRVALISLLAALALTGAKLGVGLWTNSLGILSEAAHSGLDLVAAAMTLWAVRISGQPADERHNYGHGKFENLSALAETLLLLLTCVWIIWEAVQRLSGAEHPEITSNVWGFIVVIGSIAVDYSRSRALARAAREHGSQALEADALHFSTDIWSSCVVLVGLAAVWAAHRFNLPWLALADSLAALAVAVIVIVVSLRLGRRSIDDLLDTVPPELHARVAEAAAQTPGVQEVTQVRLRRSGPSFFADVTLRIGREAAFERVHEIAEAAKAAIERVLPKADIVVHVEPIAEADEDLTTTIHVMAARHRLGAHSIRVYDEPKGPAVELHVEVEPSLSLAEAHRRATEFEHELREAAPRLRRIVTHIEPAGVSEALPASPVGKERVEQAVEEFLRTSAIQAKADKFCVQRVEGELAVRLRLRLDPQWSITAAHDVTRRLEEHLRQCLPRLGRLMIHVEPAVPLAPNAEPCVEAGQSGDAISPARDVDASSPANSHEAQRPRAS